MNDRLRHAIEGLAWDAKYRRRDQGRPHGKAPFLAEIETLDADVAAALADLPTGTLLDVGTGVGWQAIALARLGFTVTATDVSAFAIAEARAHAADREVSVRFAVDDILCTGLTDTFDVIVDRGCLSILPDSAVEDYGRQVAARLATEGRLLVKIDRPRQYRLQTIGRWFAVERTVESRYAAPNGVAAAIFSVLRLAL